MQLENFTETAIVPEHKVRRSNKSNVFNVKSTIALMFSSAIFSQYAECF